jgi:hypothetical protein
MNEPWINLDKYTLPQVLFFFTGALLWVYAYIRVVILNFKKKTVGIPLAAICLNFGWEVATVFFYPPDMGKLIVWGYRAWMIIDVIIVIQMFLYGTIQIRNEWVKKNINYFIVVGLLGGTLTHIFYMTEGFEMPMAVISAYIINLAMSIAFVGLIMNPAFNGLSKSVAWTKGIGTGIISVSFFLKYPTIHFLTTMYVLTLLFDIAYIYLLKKLRPDAEW